MVCTLVKICEIEMFSAGIFIHATRQEVKRRGDLDRSKPMRGSCMTEVEAAVVERIAANERYPSFGLMLRLRLMIYVRPMAMANRGKRSGTSILEALDA